MAGLRRRLSEFEDGIREEVERLVKIELFIRILRLLTEVEDPVPDRYRRGGREA